METVEITEPGYQKQNSLDNDIAVGIDFGTTNSLIAISNSYHPRVIKDVKGLELIPSIIEFRDDDFIIGGTLGLRSIKRLFGKNLTDVLNSPILFSLVGKLIDLNSRVLRLNITGRYLTIPEIASKIFLYLKHQAQQDLKTEITKAVITVPAHFDDAARGEVMLASKLAGFEVLRLIAEPTSAAYAYGLNKQSSGCYLVYDLGGGTFDVSILNMQVGILQVIATSGDNMLGGDDIDHLIAEYFKEQCYLQDYTNLLEVAKQAKEWLSIHEDFKRKVIDVIDNRQKHKMSFPQRRKSSKLHHTSGKSVFMDHPLRGDDTQGKNDIRDKHVSLDRKTFEQLILPLINRTINIAKDTMQAAGHVTLNGIILVGGATRIPLITKMLKETFNTTIFSDIDPDKAVALGAALQAENLTSHITNSLLIDVVPLSLGLELYGGIVEKIILRNSPLPISITKEFTTYMDNQTAMQFRIVQGEREIASDCRSLAQFELNDLLPQKAGSHRVEVTFSIDVDGILSVSALEKSSARSHIIEVRPSFGLNPEDVNEILTDAYKNASLDHTARLLQETIIKAKSLVYNTEMAIKDIPNLLPENEMQVLRKAIRMLTKAISTNNRELIIQKMQQFESMTNSFFSERLNFAVKELLKGKDINKV